MEEEKQHDWDLHAVVRGCTATATSSSASSTTTVSSSAAAAADQQDFNISSAYLEDLLQPKRETTSKQDLHVLCKPFHSRQSEITILPPTQQPFSVLNLSKPQKSTPRNKKRKANMKKVCHVAAEKLSSDVWSWRKYGQKPIKGSPYPRGYYRCSTSKGCMARKQVERNRSDPGMFILTYTGDHNHPIPTHRNTSAARSGFPQKPAEEAPTSEDSTTKPLPEMLDTCRPADDKWDEDNFSPLDDDFFEGLEGFTVGECSMDNSVAESPVMSDGGTAATNGGS